MQSPDANTRNDLVRGLLDGGTQALTSGNAKGAIALLQEYVLHDTGNVAAYLNLGKAYWQDGSLTNAISAFQRVLQLSPNNVEALQFCAASAEGIPSAGAVRRRLHGLRASRRDHRPHACSC